MQFGYELRNLVAICQFLEFASAIGGAYISALIIFLYLELKICPVFLGCPACRTVMIARGHEKCQGIAS
jgi:hypothetical protein